MRLSFFLLLSSSLLGHVLSLPLTDTPPDPEPTATNIVVVVAGDSHKRPASGSPERDQERKGDLSGLHALADEALRDKHEREARLRTLAEEAERDSRSGHAKLIELADAAEHHKMEHDKDSAFRTFVDIAAAQQALPIREGPQSPQHARPVREGSQSPQQALPLREGSQSTQQRPIGSTLRPQASEGAPKGSDHGDGGNSDDQPGKEPQAPQAAEGPFYAEGPHHDVPGWLRNWEGGGHVEFWLPRLPGWAIMLHDVSMVNKAYGQYGPSLQVRMAYETRVLPHASDPKIVMLGRGRLRIWFKKIDLPAPAESTSVSPDVDTYACSICEHEIMGKRAELHMHFETHANDHFGSPATTFSRYNVITLKSDPCRQVPHNIISYFVTADEAKAHAEMVHCFLEKVEGSGGKSLAQLTSIGIKT